MKCNKCGFRYEGNFCPHCGAPAPCGPTRCSQCGAEVQGKFCSNCGAPVMTNTKSIPILDYEAELNGSLLCKKHPLFRILICIIACLILVSGFLLLFMESYFSAVLMLIMGPILAIAAYLEDKYEYIELKGSEVIARKGFINSKSLSIPVSKIQSVSIENDLFDKIIGCRTIKIDNAGTGYTEIVMKGMQNAEQFVSAVRKAMRNSGK